MAIWLTFVGIAIGIAFVQTDQLDAESRLVFGSLATAIGIGYYEYIVKRESIEGNYVYSSKTALGIALSTLLGRFIVRLGQWFPLMILLNIYFHHLYISIIVFGGVAFGLACNEHFRYWKKID